MKKQRYGKKSLGGMIFAEIKRFHMKII